MKQIWHQWDKWECTKAGFFNTEPPEGKTEEECLQAYKNFLGDLDLFESQIIRVFKEWPISCENFLSNKSINRIAWIGQASMCIYSGVPSRFKSGYHLLNEDQKFEADNLARLYLNRWLKEHEKKN